MKRSARLQAAKAWLPKYEGKNIVRGYGKHFAVNWLCAVTELQMLGVALNEHYIEQLNQTIKSVIKANRVRKLKKKTKESQDFEPFSDEDFAYIAGDTPGGFPYGIAWEEMRRESPA